MPWIYATLLHIAISIHLIFFVTKIYVRGGGQDIQTMSFENAATLPCGLATVGLGFYKHLEIPFLTYPVEPKTGPFILIYGGSSATGSLGIQVAKLYVDFSFIFFQDLYVARDFG